MAIKISGTTLGNLTGGPLSINLYDLADVGITTPQTAQYLRYNGTISEWQNASINSDVFTYIDGALAVTNGITKLAIPGVNLFTLGLGDITPTSVAAIGTITSSNISGTNTGDQTITLTGDVTGSGTASFATTLATVNSNIGTYGSGTQIPVITVNSKGLVTSVSASAFTGVAPTADALSTGRTISATGDASWSVTFDGSSNVTSALTLATVNASPQTDQFRRITVNSKGLVTATSAVTLGDITTALGYTPVDKAGDTMTGALLLSGDPTAALGAVTKQYADNISSGIVSKPAVKAATTADLSAVYDNGSLGVGATLTIAPSATLSIDGVTSWAIQDGILVKDQTAALQNGRYYVSQLGDALTSWVLTRCQYCDQSSEISGSYTFVQDGTQEGTGWVQIVDNPDTFVVGTDAINVYQFSGSGTYTAGTGISVASNVISNTGVTSITAGSNISVSTSTGDITLSVINNSVTLGTTSIALGSTATDIAGLTTVSSSGFIGTSANSENPTISQVIVTNGTDNTYRKSSITHLATAVATANQSSQVTSTYTGANGSWVSQDTSGAPFFVDATQAADNYAPMVKIRRPRTTGTTTISLGAITNPAGDTIDAALHLIGDGDTPERRWYFNATGDFTSQGNVTAYSDARLKADWKGLGADFVKSLSNVQSGTYTRTDTGTRQVGVSAQSLQLVMPEAVLQDSQGMMSVSYGNAALAAVIELAKEVTALKAYVEELKAEVDSLKGNV